MYLNDSDFERVQNSSVRRDLRILKKKIIEWESKSKNILDNISPFSFEESKARIYSNTVTSIPYLYKLFDDKISSLNEKGKVSTRNIYNEAKNSFKTFKSKVYLIDITSEFLDKYEACMLDNNKSITTISMYPVFKVNI